MDITVINPATGQTIGHYQTLSNDQIDLQLETAQQCFLEWKKIAIAERSRLMLKAAAILLNKKEHYAALMTKEMGKPITAARGEVEKCAWVCRYYAENAATFLADEIIPTEASKSFIHYEPLGVILAVMPWNFPFWQVFRFAAPALMAGNTAVLKHASNVPGCALAIEEVFTEAGFPKGAFNTLIASSSQVEHIIAHQHIKAATLTGSEKAGVSVASNAGKHLKKTVLELGGSDPYIILEDAELEAAAKATATSRLINSGQSCIAAKRVIVVEAVYDAFLKHFTAAMQSAKLGDPTDENTTIGPQARYDLRDQLHQQVQDSIKAGAQCILGGSIPQDIKGAYYPATILTKVKPGMPAYEEELFGPVAAIITAKDEQEAIKIANDSPFGLGAAVFTRDQKKGERIAANELHAGCCFVNAFVKSDPRLPFGGIGISGYGRELSSHGIRAFTNIKTVWVD